jgi:hypothetical protein
VADNKKFQISLFFKVFLIITSVFKDKKSKRSHIKIEISRFFLTFFVYGWKDPDPYNIITDPDPGCLKTSGSGSTTLQGT